MSESSSFVRGSFLALLLIGLVALAGGGFLLSRGDKIAAPPPTAAPAPRPVPNINIFARMRPNADAPTAPVSSAAANAGGPSTAGGGDTAAEIARNRAILDKLTSAPALLDAPKAMTIGQTRPVELRIGIGVPAESLTLPGEPGNQQIPGQTRVSPNMKATLDGAGFTIRASTPEQLPIAEGNVTFWRWDVQAQEAGEHDLKATLYALVPDAYQVKTYDQMVVVNVKAKTFSEWLDEIAQDVDKIKGIVLTIGGLAMTVGGWLGFSRARKTGETPSAS